MTGRLLRVTAARFRNGFAHHGGYLRDPGGELVLDHIIVLGVLSRELHHRSITLTVELFRPACRGKVPVLDPDVFART